MPTRDLTPDEAAEFDARKALAAAKATYEAKDAACMDAEVERSAAYTAYQDARNDLLRLVGSSE